RQPGDPDVGTRFRVLTEAYEVLSDPARRAWYDTSSRAGQRASRPPGEAAATARRQPGSQPPKHRKTSPPRMSPLASAPLQAGPPRGRRPAAAEHGAEHGRAAHRSRAPRPGDARGDPPPAGRGQPPQSRSPRPTRAAGQPQLIRPG